MEKNINRKIAQYSNQFKEKITDEIKQLDINQTSCVVPLVSISCSSNGCSQIQTCHGRSTCKCNRHRAQHRYRSAFLY